MVSRPLSNCSSPKLSFGEWIASSASPKPRSSDLMPRIDSKPLMIGMDPPE